MVGDLHFTLAACEQLIRNDKLNVKALGEVGLTLRRLNRPTESRKCYKTAVEALLYAMKIGNVEAVLSFEVLIHRAFVATVEDEDHYYRCYSDWRAEMARFGRRFRDPAVPMSANTRNVAFILPSGSLLGHTEVLFNLLREDAAIRKLGIVPRIYVLYDYYEPFLKRAAAAGLQVRLAAGELQEGYHATELQRLSWLRSKLVEDDCGVAVWLTAAAGSIFMLSAGLAPVQIFWALRFHPIAGPFIDGYITYGPKHRTTKMVGKTAWQVCPVPLALEIVDHDAAAIAEARARFPQRFLMGTLARPEKIDSKPFLEAVVRILQQNPHTAYLWTGRDRHAGIQQFFESAGVAGRCHFVGWVDTWLYARVLDLFLESFPLGCGVTGYQALGTGTALLSYLEDNTVFGMQFGTGAESQAGASDSDTESSPILCARNPDEYVALAGRLVADGAFREAVAARGRAFFTNEINNGEYYATRFFETVISIADKTLAARKGSSDGALAAKLAPASG